MLLVQDFTNEIVEEWKGWLTGSLPVASIAITGLVMPEWIHLPLWVWALLIFVADLLLAMFLVYRELRQQRDTLQKIVGWLRYSWTIHARTILKSHRSFWWKVTQKGVEP